MRVFRQTFCATITLHDKRGAALHTIRYGRMPEGDVTGLGESVCDDAPALLTSCSSLTVTAICNGAHELWALLGQHLATVSKRVAITELIDMWHLQEKLGAAARVQHSAAAASSCVTRWRTSLLNHAGAARRIASEIASWARSG